VARSAAGFIQRIDDTAKKLDGAIADIRRVVLNEQTLTNFAQAVNNLRSTSEQALNTVSNLNHLVATNGVQVGVAVSNIVFFSHQLNGLADSADGLLASNGVDLSVATKNISSSTAILKNVLTDVQAGKGLAGTLLQDQVLSSNVQAIAGNLAVTTSNLNREGLWGILWSHTPQKPARTNSVGPASNPKSK
jgi:ABC-type transporter Mla subunit MlaD